MLRSSKMPPKAHKSSKDAVLRKSHMLKKSHRSGSPMRIPNSSRSSLNMKHISPGQRVHPMEKRKSSHSPRMRSIAMSPHRSLPRRKPESPVTMERVDSVKNLKYEKRKHLSNSSVRRLSPPPSRRAVVPMHGHSMNPYAGEKYPGSASGSLPYMSPTRKKMRRDPEHYFTNERISTSPPRRHPVPPLNPQSHMSRREAPTHMHEKRNSSPPVSRGKHVYDGHSKLISPLGMPSNHLKAPLMKATYPPENSSRYVSSSLSKSYPSAGQKSVGPTLHERFSSVVESNRSETRIKYSREDLEKITIDIRRNLREQSPTLRCIINPADVKLVRRPNEGHRPIFDRDEIKQAPRDLREDAYYERKKMASSYKSGHGIDLREVENYQITRHRFDRDHDLFSTSSGRTLNDRWQNPEGRKEFPTHDRDLREKEYVRNQPSDTYAVTRSRSRSGDRDFRTERYIDTKSAPSRSEYPRRPANIIPPPRSAPNTLQKRGIAGDARNKFSVRKNDVRPPSLRSEPKNGYNSHPGRPYPESVPSSRIERRDRHSPVPDSKWGYRGRSSSREKDYPRPAEKSYSKHWSERPSMPQKGPNFYESERRESSSSYSRGGSRPFHSSRGNMRGRGFRGSRGSSFRGSYRGNTSSPRGRGMIRR